MFSQRLLTTNWTKTPTPLLKQTKTFPDQAQPESHQLLHYRQNGPTPKGKEPKYRKAYIHPLTSKVDDQLIKHPVRK